MRIQSWGRDCNSNAPTIKRTYEEVLSQVEHLPAADVEEVRHGEWIPYEFETYCPAEFDENGDLITHKYTHYKCSLCGEQNREIKPYCPGCGAKMNKEN